MSEIEIDITPESLDDSNRQELMWSNRQEKFLKQCGDSCKLRSVKHDIQAKRNKLKFAIFGVPSMLIPIVLSGISSLAECNSLIYSLGMMGCGILTSIGVFFNFGRKTQMHFEYSHRYAELANDVETELCKPKRSRTACDVYIERTKLNFNSLGSQAPHI